MTLRFFYFIKKYVDYQLKYDPQTRAWSITKNKMYDQLAGQLKKSQRHNSVCWEYYF